MNYTETSAAIYANAWFRDRVRVATSTYANYLLNAATDDPEYAAKINAGTRISQQNDMIVNQLMFTLSGDSEVQAAGPSIADAQLQLIVEKTIVKFVPVQPVTPAGMGYAYPTPPAPPPRPQ